MEETLPRGDVQRGPSSVKKPNLEKDDLFKACDSDLPKKRSRKRARKSQELESEENVGSSVVVEPLTIRLLAEGLVLLGRVQQVQEFGLRVSLPGAITGRVTMTNISQPYSLLLRQFAQGAQEETMEILPLPRLFQEGQTVVCKVISAAPVEWGSSKVSVNLSLDPSAVNASMTSSTLQKGMVLQAAVASIEDHGYTMDCGIEGVSAFLSRAEAAAFIKKCNAGHALAVGQLIQCAILADTGGRRAVQLTARPSTVNAPAELQNFTLDHVLPGCRAELTIIESQEEGLVVSWQGINACVHRSHLPGPWDKPKEIVVGETFVGALLYVQPLVQRPYLSIQGPLGRQPFGTVRPGALLENSAQVVAVEAGAVHLRLEPSGVRALCPRPLVSDQDVDDARNFITAGECLSCRVMALSYMDRVVVVSLKKSMLLEKYVAPEALVPGAKFQCTVRQVLASGLLVSLSPWLTGFIQSLHVSDREGEKHAVGSSLRCRLLSIDRSSDPPRLLLTCRRALVTSRRPIITSYDDATPGKVTNGLIVRVTPKGLLVTLYNNVKGWIPPREIPCPVHGIEVNYAPGKIVTCRVVDCQPSEERMTLSLKLAAKGGEDEEKFIQLWKTSLKPGSVEVGMLVSGIIDTRVEDGFTVILCSGERASLPRRHLSDIEQHCKRLQRFLPDRSNLTNLVVFNSGEHLVVSRKASLVNAAHRGLFISSFEDMELGALVFGVLLAFVRHGMLLELPAGVRGFVPLKDVADEFLSDASKSGFVIGQCLVAKVTKVDSETRQVWLSTSMRSCGGEMGIRATMESLAAQLCDEELLSKLERSQVPAVSSIVRVTVQHVDKEDNVIHSIINEGSLLATAETLPGRSMASGSTHDAVVLYCCPEQSALELSLDPQVVRSVNAASRWKPVQRRMQCGRVLLVKHSHIVVLMHSGHLCLVPTKSHLNSTFCLPLVKRANVSVWTWKVCGNISVGCTKATANQLKRIEAAGFVSQEEKIAPASNVVPQQSKQGSQAEGVEFVSCEMDGSLAIEQHDIGTLPYKQKRVQSETTCDEHGLEAFKDMRSYDSGAEEPALEADLENAVGTAPSGKTTKTTSLNPERGTSEQSSKRVKEGMQTFLAVVRSVEKLQLKVTLENGYKGRVHISFVDEHPNEGENPLKRFEPGDEIEVYVLERVIPLHSRALAITGRRNFCECSLFPAICTDFAPAPGSEVIGYFSHFSEGNLFFTLTHNKMGKLPVLNMDLPPTRLAYIQRDLKAGQAVKLKVLRADESSMVELSQLDVTTLAIDSVVNGCVVSTRAGVGACVSLPLGYHGTISITDVCDDFTQTAALMEDYTQERYLQCYILDIDSETNTYHLSTRESRLHPDSDREVLDGEVVALSNLSLGSTLRGFVKTMNKHGCFVTVGCGVDGLIPLSRLPSPLQRNYKALKLGELVNVVVRKIQASERRLFLDLVHYGQVKTAVTRKRKLSTSSIDEPVFDSSEKRARLDTLPRLSLDEGFNWDVQATPDLASLLNEQPLLGSSDDEDDDGSKARKSHKEIRLEREQAEAELRKKERMLVDPRREPETVDDFDRLVLTSPNSSIVWLRYMAYHLRQAEIEKARAVARRALACIEFREEQEKLNVWTALLNLEHLYGTQDSLDSVFKEALQFNEPLKIYMHLAQIYVAGSKQEQAEQLYKQMLNKFKQHADVWLSFGLFYIKSGQAEACRALLQRALKSVPSWEHIGLISKFAQMEFKYGDAERGRSMFNSILDNYPKRTDLWLVYVDMLMKHSDFDNARRTFEKATSLNLNPKKMKSLFKKWLDFEKKYGDAALCKEVKQRAVQYVEQRTSASH